MDPNATLKIARAAVEQINAETDLGDACDYSRVSLSVPELAEAFEALDQWLSKGGFLPAAWRENPDSWCANCGEPPQEDR